MMTFLKSRYLSSVAYALLLCNVLSADVSNDTPKAHLQEQHVVIGSRPIDPEKLAKIEEQELQRAYEVENPTLPPSSPLHSSSRAVFRDDGKPAFRLANAEVEKPVLSTVNFPVLCHWISWRSDDRQRIKIEDGSTWEIAESDVATINSWSNDDALFITPNTSWWFLTKKKYYITRELDGSYVQANLIDGPVVYGPYSHWVIGLDVTQGQIFLENQSVWCVDPNDLYILTDRVNKTDWAEKDHIIMIEDKRAKDYKYVFINVNMNCKVHVKPY